MLDDEYMSMYYLFYDFIYFIKAINENRAVQVNIKFRSHHWTKLDFLLSLKITLPAAPKSSRETAGKPLPAETT